ncbi:hypothetical protein FRC02_003616 [Tulasnella sp. 418]|nr:hypothetical protein FRC02_003616 [Tulasnella sp. 418]
MSTSPKPDRAKRAEYAEMATHLIGHMDISQMNLTGKIDKGEQITWGNYSDVWRGTLLKDDGKVETIAIKALRVRQSSNPISTTPREERIHKRFYREVSLWAKLQHPNVTPLLGYTLDSDGIPTLISPWYSYGNLIEYLTSNPIANRLSLASDITEALEYLHSIPVVHGDLKPENVLVDAEGSARLCDFGMAQFLDEALRNTGYTTSTGNAGGTDRYFCPELLDGEPKTIMSDIWALGCVVMLTLTGHRPYQQHNTRVATFKAIMIGDLPYKKPGKFIKESLSNALVRCWSFDPKDRPSTSDLVSHLCEGRRSNKQVQVDSGNDTEEHARHLDEQGAMIKTLNKQLTHCEGDLQAHMDLVATLEASLTNSERNRRSILTKNSILYRRTSTPVRKARMQSNELARERDSYQQQCTNLRMQLAEAQREVSNVRQSAVEEKMSLEQRLDEERRAKERARAQLDSRMEELMKRKSKFVAL